MARRKPERDQIEKLLKENRGRKAHDIAEEVGLVATMGYEKAVDYVRYVRKSMKSSGAFPVEKYKFASDSERLENITKLFELRAGKKVDRRVAKTMLLLNCYYRLRSEDDDIHWRAFDDTYEKNNALVDPLEMSIAINLCEVALMKYTVSRDEKKTEAAKKRGLPGAGMNFASETLITILTISDEELQYMKSIRRG